MNFYILAGGHSRRLGQNKALLKIDGVTLIERVIAAVPAEMNKITIVTNSPEEYFFLPHGKISDILPQCGPLSGIHAGLVNSDTAFSFFLACDLPFLSQEIISGIVTRHRGQGIFGAKTEDGLQPLCAIYSKSCVSVIESMMQKQNYSLHDLARNVNSEFIAVEGKDQFFNVNTVADWQSLLHRKQHKT